MSLLLKNALISDLKSPHHNTKCNISIENGLITSFQGKNASTEVDLEGMMVSPGWFDLNANFNDPGREHKEDLNTGLAVASSGGFTDIQLCPDTFPPLETKSQVEYVANKSAMGVDLRVTGALSEGLKGENLCEILDLQAAGVTSISDGDQPIWNSKLLLKSLQYTRDINLPVFQNPSDPYLSDNTHMHEGMYSTQLGLRGEPSLSEELMIKRDLDILRYAGGKLHFTKISTAKAVSLIKAAKEQGLSVTADVGIHHLLFTDESVGQFDSNFKSTPPYRTEIDRKALIEGVKSGVIDAICSNHRPQDQESKQLEFDLAEAGSISLQTFYPVLLKISKEVPMEILLDRITHGPRKVLGLEPVIVDKHSPAKLSILNPGFTWKLDVNSNRSKAMNSPFWLQEMKGIVYGIVNGDFYSFFD